MKKVRAILVWMMIMRPSAKEGRFYANTKNPLTWIFFLICAIVSGVGGFIDGVTDFIKDSIDSQKQNIKHKK